MIEIGAPPQEAAKSLEDHSMPFQYGPNNVLAAGQAASACGSNLNRDRKQELVEIREEGLLLKLA